MRGRLRVPIVLFLLVAMTLAGCLGGRGDAGDFPVDLPDVTTQPMPPGGPVLPPCTLQAGPAITWPAVAGAPRPSAPVQVTLKTDAYGVTHIYADDAYSLWYANGYVQARDRLFQMDVLRLVGKGESARYLGAGQLASDFEVHRDLYTAAERQAQFAAAPREAQEVLEAFADGVNRFLAEAAARNALPAEFAAVGREPPPWTPDDSVAVINYLIGYFGVAGGHELSNLRLLAQLEETLGPAAGWDAFGDMVWLRSDDTYTTIAADQRVFNGCEDPLPERDAAVAQTTALAAAKDAVTLGVPGPGSVGVGGLLPSLPPGYDPAPGSGLFSGFKWGSNALLVDGSRTATGEPIMWGAPQMGYYKPPVPYQVGLHGAGYDAAGIGIAGAPGLVIGRNAHIAWTATSGIEDQVDLVQLPLTGPRTYLWDGQERAMECWTVVHQTFPAPAELAAVPDVGPPMMYEQEVCRAEGWPVVAIHEQAGFAWKRMTTTWMQEMPGALKWLGVAKAGSLEEFRTMMADFPFTFNFHVASRDGVMFLHTGHIPLRADGLDPRLPTPAGDAHKWRGTAYTAQMDTWATDPSRGYFANWNNAPGWGWRTGDEPTLWGPVQRVQQIEYWMQQRLAETGNALTWQDVADVNWLAATHDSLALPFLPHLVQAATGEPDLADVREALHDWARAGAPWRDDDGDGRYDDPAHAIWDFMMQDMLDRIQGDVLGPSTPQMNLDPKSHSDPHAADHGPVNTRLSPILKALQGNTAHDWCNDIRTPQRETCREQLATGLRAAKDALTAGYGPDIADWLAPVHTTTFTAIGGSHPDEMPMVNKGSWVQVVSMAESAKSASALPPSNTGLLTTPELLLLVGTGMEPSRLTSELEMYWRGDFKPFPLTVAEVDAVAVSTATLVVLPPPGPPGETVSWSTMRAIASASLPRANA